MSFLYCSYKHSTAKNMISYGRRVPAAAYLIRQLFDPLHSLPNTYMVISKDENYTIR